ncbi:hypothetical protein P8C59_006698 [Phyllachora maydis]|uniref:Uncharacterized protein n=1 Tax=Phyllachora maydis TaxID=1825666 RepID=A0AAD9I833_9PEZI|nr:hypothetical protein P8C59_006698 [Phyllachora maydis]
MFRCILLAGIAAAAAVRPRSLTNFVTLGDSYTDNGRLDYYLGHEDKAPPAGTLPPPSSVAASGGLAWGQVVAAQTGVNYVDYAVSGATGSDAIVPRFLAAHNQTEYAAKMREYTTLVNAVIAAGVPLQLLRQRRWPGAVFSVLDVHALLVDVHSHRRAYPDAPYNTAGFYHHRPPSRQNCTALSDLGPLSGFKWYDELHPSTKTASIVAQHLIDVVYGNSTYGVTYSLASQ